MNWKLILQLSLFGLVMGVGTVFVIPSTLEPFLWLVVFVISAYLIATRAADRYFLHGVALGLANCVWVTGAHVLFFAQYISRHPAEQARMTTMPLATHPRVLMLIVGPLIGLLSGVVIGLFAMLAHRLAVPRARPAVSSS